MRAGGFAAGSALLVPREIRHDTRTAQIIAGYRTRLAARTDAAVIAAAAALKDDPRPVAAELLEIAVAELAARHLSLAPLAGGTK